MWSHKPYIWLTEIFHKGMYILTVSTDLYYKIIKKKIKQGLRLRKKICQKRLRKKIHCSRVFRTQLQNPLFVFFFSSCVQVIDKTQQHKHFFVTRK